MKRRTITETFVQRFYLSYAEKGKKILEPLCGSGRFLVPFVERGLDISGIDLSNEMLQKLKQKLPEAKVVQADIIKYSPREKFEYIYQLGLCVIIYRY